jgi:hypothetical protein
MVLLEVSNLWPEVAKIALRGEGSSLGPKGRAPKGLQDSAQGFNPGNCRPKRHALTRHMNVRSMNNTRSSGLEMLKGRQIECTNNA